MPILKLDDSPLTAADLKLAEKELRETPKRVQESLAELRTLIALDGEIDVPLTDSFLIRFLRPTKFYPQSALNLLRRALLFREKNASLLASLMPADEEAAILGTSAMNVLADRDSFGRRIVVLSLGNNWNPDILSTEKLLRLFYILHVLAQIEPRTQVNGGVLLIDMEGFSLKHVRHLTPSLIMTFTELGQECAAVRIKEFHVIRQPAVFNIVWKIFQPFVIEKMRKRTFLHGYDMGSLHKFIPASDLPKDFGGTLPQITYGPKDWYPVLRTLDNYFHEWNRCCIRKTRK